MCICDESVGCSVGFIRGIGGGLEMLTARVVMEK